MKVVGENWRWLSGVAYAVFCVLQCIWWRIFSLYLTKGTFKLVKNRASVMHERAKLQTILEELMVRMWWFPFVMLCHITWKIGFQHCGLSSSLVTSLPVILSGTVAVSRMWHIYIPAECKSMNLVLFSVTLMTVLDVTGVHRWEWHLSAPSQHLPSLVCDWQIGLMRELSVCELSVFLLLCLSLCICFCLSHSLYFHSTDPIFWHTSKFIKSVYTRLSLR